MWEWNVKRQFFKTELAGGLASQLDWVSSSSREWTEWPVWTFCPVVLQLSWWFSFSACFTCVHLLVACQSRATRVRDPVASPCFSAQSWAFLHTLPLHDSHLNTGFLSAELQANWHGIKLTKWLIKFNLTNFINYACIVVFVYWLIDFFWECSLIVAEWYNLNSWVWNCILMFFTALVYKYIMFTYMMKWMMMIRNLGLWL